jgi:hypothetical protein
MKKVIFISVITLICFSIYSISNETFLTRYMVHIVGDEEGILRFKAEDALKDKLNDPGSYEFVSFENDVISGIFERNDTNTKYYILNFRSKNGFGAVTLGSSRITTKNGFVMNVE